jgi:hypothetical protein
MTAYWLLPTANCCKPSKPPIEQATACSTSRIYLRCLALYNVVTSFPAKEHAPSTQKRIPLLKAFQNSPHLRLFM